MSLNRSGRRSPRRRIGCARGSKGCWRGPRPKNASRATACRPHGPIPPRYAGTSIHGLLEGTAALALRFCILTATRTNETLGATWGEIDIEKRLWIIPAARMKGRKGKKREHRVPLSPAALAVLDKAKDFGQAPDAPVFPGQRSDGHLSNMAFLALLHRRGLDVTAHGFRSSFSTWASETTDHAREVVEMSLAHAIPNAVEAAYRRGSLLAKRTALMEDWGRYCTRRKAAMRKR